MKRKLSVATVTHGVDVCSQLRYRKLTPAISGDGGGNLSWDSQCQRLFQSMSQSVNQIPILSQEVPCMLRNRCGRCPESRPKG